jgi:hypothetical protein
MRSTHGEAVHGNAKRPRVSRRDSQCEAPTHAVRRKAQLCRSRFACVDTASAVETTRRVGPKTIFDMKINLPGNLELVFHRGVLRPLINGVRQALDLPPTPSNGVLAPLQIRARTSAGTSVAPTRRNPPISESTAQPTQESPLIKHPSRAHDNPLVLPDDTIHARPTPETSGSDAPPTQATPLAKHPSTANENPVPLPDDTIDAPTRATGTKPGPQMSDETMDGILGTMLMVGAWRPDASRQLAQHTHPLQDHHKHLARLLDAVYKHHFNGSFGIESIDSVPSDEELKELLAGLNIDRELKDFAPRARETLKILYDDFERLPLLKAIPANQRWRLLVDRAKIDMLAKHGIDTSNPLLCFIFERDAGYAHGLAQGMKFTAECIANGRDLSVGLIKEMAAACGAGETNGMGRRLGAYSTPDGVAALANWMLELGKRYGINTVAYAPKHPVVSVYHGTPHVGAWKGTIESSIQQSQPTQEPLATLAQQGFSTDGPTQFVYLDRSRCDDETLTRALEDFVGAYQTRMANASSSDERLLAAATLYFDCEHLHPFRDGNFRVFGKLLPMFLLAKQGEPPTEIYDPMTSDGNSPRELVEVFKEGQAWVKSLSDPAS